ncbi:MAG: hypothetical protein WC009_11390 [Methylotenera sp.]
MRIEQPQFFIYGMFLFACAWAFSKPISSAKLKLHLRAIFLAFSLGFIVVPGHGEFVIGPVLACFIPPIRPHLIFLGSVFFFIWWAISLGLLKSLTHHSSGTPNGAP